ncbi:MAG: 16S rRNA processing protein RimM [Desulfovibrio sp. MES5]|uniref:ribosome maturation factor RimM n=1 Tax=Desulfovibrio sp. MES5 TaxID=1899016 RepID=UPI000B9CEA27|nr:ribosome maturation factor RimM [Desulfovibrio sp. MES5]OXS28948.1 MAG: 16S rRNA processing protein RimM [Desulfovibrio sp. MES5]
MADSWIHMGTLARPHGIKGEICIDWYADSPLLLTTPLWIQAGNAEPRPIRPLAVRSHKGRPLLLLEGVADRTAAENFRGYKLLTKRETLPEPDDDEVYLEDLLGGDVLLPDGQRIGRLDHFEYPADLEMWVIMTDDDREVLFPARPEFIVGFDVEAPAVVIDPPEGLLDIYLSDNSEKKQDM